MPDPCASALGHACSGHILLLRADASTAAIAELTSGHIRLVSAYSGVRLSSNARLLRPPALGNARPYQVVIAPAQLGLHSAMPDPCASVLGHAALDK